MGKTRKAFVWAASGLGVLLALLIIFMLVLPRFLDSESMKVRVEEIISQKLAGQVSYRSTDLSFFPRPHILIEKAAVSIPERLDGSLDALTVYPKILPLFKGRIRVAKVELERPDFDLTLPERLDRKETAAESRSKDAIPEELARLLAPLAHTAPDLIIVIDGGSLDLLEKDQPRFSFQDLDGRLVFPVGQFKIDLACQSNLWEKISVQGSFDPADFTGKGGINVASLRTDRLMAYFLPDTTQALLKSMGELKPATIKGAFQFDNEKAAVSLTELNMDAPKLKLTGELLLDKASRKSSLKLEGRELDVPSIRKAALSLAGHIPVAQGIFNIVRGGAIPVVTLQSNGSSPADLGSIDNMVIKGKMQDGQIFVPGANLDLRDVQGDVVISGGILEGSKISARLENALGREGQLRLGLTGKDAPLHLEAIIETDLSQVPPLLKGLVQNEAFLREMGGIEEIGGRAVGRLVLGESTGAVKASVDVSEFSLSAKYQRIPHRIEIEAGQFSYDGDNIGVTNLSGKLGQSAFSALTAQLHTGKEPNLNVASGKATLALNEIYPWLSSYPKTKEALKNVKSVGGTVAVSAIALKGPLLKPETWRFKTTGSVKNLAVHSTLAPGVVQLSGGTFHATEQELTFSDARTRLLDASLTASGLIHDYVKGLSKAEISLGGDAGPEAVRWVSDRINLPPELNFRAPLSVSTSSLVWDKGGRTSFKGDLSVPRGPKVSVDLYTTPDELLIRNLSVKDQESDSSLSLDLKDREFHLNFSGNVTAGTTERILVKSRFPRGWVKGDFETHVILDQPARSTGRGKLEGKDLIFPWNVGVPTKIDRISLAAIGDRVNVEAMDLTWGDKQISVQGEVHVSSNMWLADMSLMTNGIEWETLRKAFDQEKGEKTKRKDDFWDLPIEGVVRLQSDYFTYDKYTWKPVRADVSLARDEISIAVSEADLCGISFPGVLKVMPRSLSLDFQPVSKNQALDPAIACLWKEKQYMTGTFDLTGDLTTQGAAGELLEGLHGNIAFNATGGRIYKARWLARTFALINVTEIFRGGLPDLRTEGLPYQSATVRGELQGGKLVLQEAILDGPTVEIVGQGEINFGNKSQDLKVLVAPLKTVDSVVGKIPIIGGITRGTLVTIPVSVSGPMGDPKVTYLTSSAVGSELYGMLKKTLKFPFKIFEPVTPTRGER
jgi:hypothetical protein